MAENDMLTGYLAGQSDSNGGGMFGGDGSFIWALLIIALLFGGLGFGGMGGGMFGGGFGMMPMMMFNGMATRADINEGFALNNITSGIQGIQQGICDSTYALNNTMTNGFHGVDSAICNLGYTMQGGFNSIAHQISDCCCTTQRAIDGVNYNLATQTNALQQAMCNNTRDIIDSQNAGTRAVLDFLVQEKMSAKDATIAQLQNQVAFSELKASNRALIEASTAEILRRSGHDCPSAAYIVQPPTPVSFPTNSCGVAQVGGYGNGCGCGCAA